MKGAKLNQDPNYQYTNSTPLFGTVELSMDIKNEPSPRNV